MNIAWKDSFSQVVLDYSLRPKVSRENFSWNIAGNSRGEKPNILSELLWRNNMRVGADLKLGIKLKRKFTAEITYGYAKTISGKVTDIDYSADNRKGITSNETYDSDVGNGQTFNIKLGYNVHMQRKELDIYAVMQLQKNSYSLIDKMEKLSSTYNNRILGAGIGAIFFLPFFDSFDLNILFQARMSKFNGDANWNLRSDFAHPKSFEHDIPIVEWDNEVRLNYRLTNFLKMGVFTGFSRYSSIGRGIDKLYYNDGNISFTRLNEVKALSISAGLSILYSVYFKN
ncbi:hypothetical protein [Sphingobacterium sp. 2149]|uniref:hypothetical protein n=1 Tax=Sphingobacterium sp. 2149 TaxID=2817763 RepID=UPI001AE6DF77|nr:hypothetical protein [Sphingobacterium sp. 2149]MDR6733608.1 hypothetical protein [Sphingobacterium sp. 2149]